MKKFRGVFTIGFLWAVSTAPLYGMFEPKDSTIIHPAVAIKATDFHEMGIKGKGFKVAVIDRGFHPYYMNEIKKSVDPSAFRENLVYNPDENLHTIDVAALERAISFLKNRINKNNETQREELDLYSKKTPNFTTLFNKNLFINKHINNELDQKEIERLEALIKKKNKFDALFENEQGHGSLVVEAVLAVAPEVRVFPIDVDPDGPRGHITTSSAVKTALQHNVDVINISLGFEYCPKWNNREVFQRLKEGDVEAMIEACKLAQLQDVPIIFSAGNNSITFNRRFLKVHVPKFIEYNSEQEPLQESPTPSAIMTVFKGVQGKGIWFAAAHTYLKGEKVLTDFTNYPLETTIKNCIFTPGERIFTDFACDSWGGTSASAPILTAAYILAKEDDLKTNNFISSETTLERMRISGKEIFHNFKGFACNSKGHHLIHEKHLAQSGEEYEKHGGNEPDETVYRALDLRKFKKKSEEKNKLVAPPYVPMKDEGGFSLLSSLSSLFLL